MNADPTPAQFPRSTVIAVITVTTLAQVASVMGITVFPVIAPELAVNLGVEPSLVGYQISLIYGVAMFASPFLSNMVPRWGACRMIQVGLGFGAVAMLLAMSSNLAALLVVSVLLGLGMAAMPSASAHLLFRFAPPRHRNLIFSLKQTGIPLAWVLMAALAPAITLALGWEWALALVLVTALATAVTMQRWREQWDDDRGTAAGQSPNLSAGLGLVWHYPVLRWLAVMSFCYTFVQLCLCRDHAGAGSRLHSGGRWPVVFAHQRHGRYRPHLLGLAGRLRRQQPAGSGGARPGHDDLLRYVGTRVGSVARLGAHGVDSSVRCERDRMERDIPRRNCAAQSARPGKHSHGRRDGLDLRWRSGRPGTVCRGL
jgi:hypothetical protein